MTDTPTRKPRRSPQEIAQAHADKAVKAVEKHDEKAEKVKARYEKIKAEYDGLAERREELVAEADYRQAHPLLRKKQKEQDVDNPFDF